MWTTIAAIAAFAVVAVLTIAATKPDIFRVSRSVAMNAVPEKIFPYLNDPRKNQEWSPFDKREFKMTREFSGAAEGVGAVYDFADDGHNTKVGTGRITIIESVPAKKVVMTLDMFKPMTASNVVTYTLSLKGGATEMTWTMEGKMPFLYKIVHVFMNMDKMMANEFDNGLAALKAIVEK